LGDSAVPAESSCLTPINSQKSYWQAPNCGCRLKLMSNYPEAKLMAFPLYMTLIT
jgi:hypothetical protein